MRVAFVEWPEGLEAGDAAWSAIRARMREAVPQVLVTNEMPFGPWLAAAARYDDGRARDSIRSHEAGLEALRMLDLPLILSSRPVRAGERLANEAFALEGGIYRALHQKHYFPAEEGWFEAGWFQTAVPGFEAVTVAGLRVGVMLCTELMFNEHARAYGRAGADLIVAPRATGAPHEEWKIAGAMAALVSGSYVVSSNRVGAGARGPGFGGCGFAFAPGGRLLGETSAAMPLVTFDLDLVLAAGAKKQYPCYVPETARSA